MTTTMPERPRFAAHDPAIKAAVRPQASVTVGCGVTHLFSAAELDVAGHGGEGLVAVAVIGLECVGVLSVGGSPVMVNDVVPIESLEAGELQYAPGSGEPCLDHDSFLFAVHDGEGWSLPTQMHIHTVAAAQLSYVEPLVATPTAQDGTVKTEEGTPYVFKPTDFNFQGPESEFAFVQLTSVDTCGTVNLHKRPVTLGQVIEVDDIDLELLTFEPADPGKEGIEFRVHDGEQWSQVEYSMVIEVASHYLPPTASDSEVVVGVDETYVLRAEDFRYNDFAGDELARVSLSNLVLTGSLRLDGGAVESNQVITQADLSAGRLEYKPSVVGGADSVRFRVHDGTAYSAASYQMKFITKARPVTFG